MSGNTEQQARATSGAGETQSAVRRYDIARSTAISIEVYLLGTGPAIVLLPSLGRGPVEIRRRFAGRNATVWRSGAG